MGDINPILDIYKKDGLVIYFMDHSKASEEAIIKNINCVEELIKKENAYFGFIWDTVGMEITPAINSQGKKLEKVTATADKYVGSSIIRSNNFMTLLLKLFVRSDMFFVTNKKNAEEAILTNYYKKKEPLQKNVNT